MNEALIALIQKAIVALADAAMALGQNRVSAREIERLYDEANNAYVDVIRFIQGVDITAKTS